MDDEELKSKIEQLRENRGGRTAQYQSQREAVHAPAEVEFRRPERQSSSPYEGYPFEEEDESDRRLPRDDGVIGVLTYQGILSVALAILYVLLMTFAPDICQKAITEVQERTAHDFSFRDSVYETVGNFLTYLNEIEPVDLTIPGTESTALAEDELLQPDASLLPDASSSDLSESSADEADSSPAADNKSDYHTETNTVSQGSIAEEGLTGQGGEFTPVNGQKLPSNATFAPVLFTGQITFPIAGGGRITSGFGFREHPTSQEDEFHLAMDIAAAQGTNILAAADGIITVSEESGSLGKHIAIDHGNGFETVYGHCDKLVAQAGTRVREGEVIAKVGTTGDSTGYHLHYGMRKNGLYFDPLCVFTELSLPEDVMKPPSVFDND